MPPRGGGSYAAASCPRNHSRTHQVGLTHLLHRRGLLAHRNGKGAHADWSAAADPEATACIYMGGAAAGEVARRLVEAGRRPATPVLVVESAGRPEAREVFEGSLAQLDGAVLNSSGGPVLIVVGEATSRSAALAAEPLAATA